MQQRRTSVTENDMIDLQYFAARSKLVDCVDDHRYAIPSPLNVTLRRLEVWTITISSIDFSGNKVG